MGNVEDVEKLLIITKKKDVHHVDSQTLKWEDMMDGVKKSEQEEDKELEEWDTWKIFQEEPKTDSDQEHPPNPLLENKNEEKMTIRSFFN